MKSINVSNLLRDGYVEDISLVMKFERKYAPYFFAFILGALFGAYLAFGAGLKSLGLSIIVFFGLAALLTAIRRLHGNRIIPINLVSGKPFERYLDEDSSDSGVGYVFVDHANKIFCRRVVALERTLA